MIITLAKRPGFRLRVLLVENNEQVRALLRRLLHKTGIACVEYTDGPAALADLSTVRPDCVLADLAMQPMDGLAFARGVRRALDREMQVTPIIMMTSQIDRKLIEAARDQGVDAVLLTPVTAATLRARITDTVYRTRIFVRVPGYSGPCRRRRNTGYDGPERRKAQGDAPAAIPVSQDASSD
jgi:two-component system, chemotaxis family, chemotaxis protein CheY